jgi:hypothetical protein
LIKSQAEKKGEPSATYHANSYHYERNRNNPDSSVHYSASEIILANLLFTHRTPRLAQHHRHQHRADEQDNCVEIKRRRGTGIVVQPAVCQRQRGLFPDPPANLFQVGTKFIRVNVCLRQVGLNRLRVLLQRAKLDQPFAQHEHHVFEIGFKTACDLAQCDTVQIEDVNI